MGCCFSANPDGVDGKHSDSGGGCMRCCRDTKKCLMSPECGRALQIANVCAMCGMCINMWSCKSLECTPSCPNSPRIT